MNPAGVMNRMLPATPTRPVRRGRPRSARRLLALALCVPALAVGAPAREASYVREGAGLVHRVEASVPLERARVRVQTDLGSVRITAGAAGTTEVSYRIQVRAAGARDDEAAARRLLDRLAVSASRSGEEILFLGELRGDTVPPAGLAAQFELTVPPGTPGLEVATGQGDVSVFGVGGPVTLRVGAGIIEVRAVGGMLRAETGGGRIEATDLGGGAQLVSGAGGVRVENARGDVTVRTSGGEIVIGRVTGRVRGESGGGSVRIDEAGGEVVAETTGGNITIGRAGGRITAVTAGGSIRVGSAGAGARCETSAGSIDLRAVDGPIHAVTSAGSIRADLGPPRGVPWNGDSSLETWQGDVVLSLPESIHLSIRAMVDNPVGRAIRSDFPLTIVRDIEAAGRPMEIAEGAIGKGGPVLKLRTLGGNIVILKTSEAGR